MNQIIIDFGIENLDEIGEIFDAITTMKNFKEGGFTPLIESRKTLQELKICINSINTYFLRKIRNVVEKYNLNPNLLIEYRDIELYDFLYVLN